MAERSNSSSALQWGLWLIGELLIYSEPRQCSNAHPRAFGEVGSRGMSDIYLVRVEHNPVGTSFGVENANDPIYIYCLKNNFTFRIEVASSKFDPK